MKIFVTGGAGFVGSHLVDRFVRLGHSVVILDHHKAKKQRFVNPGAIVYKIGIGDPGLEAIFEKAVQNLQTSPTSKLNSRMPPPCGARIIPRPMKRLSRS